MPDTSRDIAIACLGWGSLVWDPRDLPCRGDWHSDGPLLPIEFARASGGAKKSDPAEKITLVICPDTPRVRTYWTLLDAADIQTARERLAVREYEDAKRYPDWIKTNTGFWERATGKSHGLEADTIAAWASAVGLAGVVWTNLPFGFKTSRGVMPNGADVVGFLRALDAAKQPEAEGYVRQAPSQIDTPYRRLIERELGWLRRG